MKFVLVLVLLACLSAVALSKRHCLDKQFTTQAVLLDAHRHYDDLHTIYYDVNSQKQRIDFHVIEPRSIKEHVFFRHDLGKTFIFNPEDNSCVSRPLEGELEQFCLTQNATHDQHLTIGGKIKCDIWVEKLYGFSLRLVEASVTGVPINLVSKGGASQGTIFQEWFNYERTVDQSKFELPPQCNQAQPLRSVAAQARANEVYERALAMTQLLRKH